MMENLSIYNAVREVPKEAQKEIKGGRISGFTDINPMWRIKTLTDQFGPCGIGWYYTIKDRWVDTSMGSDEISAGVIIELYVKFDGAWSKPIEGVGGSMFVSKERSGLHVNDECYKMALTDAISVACKALGVGANIYWGNDRSKYDIQKSKKEQKEPQHAEEFKAEALTEVNRKYIKAKCKALGIVKKGDLKKVCGAEAPDEMTTENFAKFVVYVNEKEDAIKAAQKEFKQEDIDLGL